MSLRRWNTGSIDRELAASLAEECGIDLFCSLLLTCKGISDSTEALEFLSDDINLPNPYEFCDMDKAVKRIKQSLSSGEKIAIFGDYDTDGVTSTAMLYMLLGSMHADVIYRIPTRDEGYGINSDEVDELAKAGVKLIITVDNGITAYEAIAHANSLGIDTVVTDHHLPKEKLPDAVAVVNPKREDCCSEYKDYAGVGVAFMLACALSDCSCEELLEVYGDLVAVGTIADIMPLNYDNRTIVKHGLRLLGGGSCRTGIKALLNVAGIRDGKISSRAVAYGITPRLNAVGRVSNPKEAVELLLCDDESRAEALAMLLNDANTERKRIESIIFGEAIKIIEQDPLIKYAPVLIVHSDKWHSGVIGIVAAKLCRRFAKPCIVLCSDGKLVHGSARSYWGVSIHSIICECSDLFENFGGHETAAGLSFEASKLDEVTEAINNAALKLYGAVPFETLNITCKLNPATLSVSSVYAQRRLEPFGNANEAPIYGLFGMKIERVTPVGQGKHLRLLLSRNTARVNAMLFYTEIEEFCYTAGTVVDAAVTLDINKYKGNEELSVVISSLRPSQLDFDAVAEGVRGYEVYRRSGEYPDLKINREDAVGVYKTLRKLKKVVGDEDAICSVFDTTDYMKLRIIFDILCELGFASVNENDKICIKYIEDPPKRELSKSKIFGQFN